MCAVQGFLSLVGDTEWCQAGVWRHSERRSELVRRAARREAQGGELAVRAVRTGRK